jgi:hypothetical protein
VVAGAAGEAKLCQGGEKDAVKSGAADAADAADATDATDAVYIRFMAGAVWAFIPFIRESDPAARGGVSCIDGSTKSIAVGGIVIGDDGMTCGSCGPAGGS